MKNTSAQFKAISLSEDIHSVTSIVNSSYYWGEPERAPHWSGSLCIRRSVMLCAECEQKNPIEKAI